MPEDITVLSLADRERWEAEHKEDGLPSQSWNYAFALQASGFDTRLAIVRSGSSRMLLPYFERSFMGTTDIATIPGLSGASIEPPSSAPLSLWHEYATSRGWVAGYVQLALGFEHPPITELGEVVEHNAVFVLDLRIPDILQTFSANVRRKIREAERGGAILVDDPAALADRLTQLYPQAMMRLSGDGQFLPESFQRWSRDPGCISIGARMGDEIEAVHLYRVAGTHAEGALAATTERARGLGTWIIWNAIVRLRQMGIHTLNIGGGGQVGDGIYQSKQRFNVAPTPLRSLRQIYDRRRYDELCERVGVPASVTYFPAYRAVSLEPSLEGSR